MTLQTNYEITLQHPVTELSVDGIVCFYHTKGYPESFEEPGWDDEVELISCTVEGVCVLSLMSGWQIRGIEEELLANIFN
jgi:hypothetical protein